MSIDERLEALTQTMELMVSIQRDHEAAMLKILQESERRNAELDKKFAVITRNFDSVHDSLKMLESIALAHEHRIDDLEKQS